MTRLEAAIVGVASGMTLLAIFAAIVDFPPREKDPAQIALTKAGYTKVHFFGKRYGVCDLELLTAKDHIKDGTMPVIKKEDSYDETCFFGTKFLATSPFGTKITGNMFCGPLVKEVEADTSCKIVPNVEVNDPLWSN